MKILHKWVLSAVATILLTNMVLAQTDRSAAALNVRAGDGFPLLLLPNVKKELKLTDVQQKDILAKHEEFSGQKSDDSGADSKPNSEAEQAKQLVKMDAAVVAILERSQQKRLRQIVLQVRGPGLLTQKDVAAEMQVTEQQKQSIREILHVAAKERAARLNRNSATERTPEQQIRQREYLAAQRKMTLERVLAELTDSQRRQYRQIVGEPFSLEGK